MKQPDDVFLVGIQSHIPPSAQASPLTMGFKAYNLMRMEQMGLRVPPAFVLGTAWCQREDLDDALWMSALMQLQCQVGRQLGDSRHPLLLSVRSGAPVSMPGMMETLLNVGLCDATVPGFLRQTGHPRLVWDSYRRLIATHGEVVFNVPASAFEHAWQQVAQGAEERSLDFSQLREITQRFLQVYAEHAGEPFPQDPLQQLRSAIHAVFRSWAGDKARSYRQAHGIDDTIGTAVTVQTMVFGNMGGSSGAGVGFTRNPITGEPGLWVDFLFNAQGEDVVSGRRSALGQDSLTVVLPQVWDELIQASQRLEANLKDMQDIEFTVEDGCLYMLQTRSGKRAPLAAARIALDMHQEGLITADEARSRTADLHEDDLRVAELVSADGKKWQPVSRGASANSGVATGCIAFEPDQARKMNEAGHAVILVRKDAETSDSAALAWSSGLLTERGARTSHAAVVARQMKKVCITGCADCSIDETHQTLRLGVQSFTVGDTITLDGNSGDVYAGAVQSRSAVPDGVLARLTELRTGADRVSESLSGCFP